MAATDRRKAFKLVSTALQDEAVEVQQNVKTVRPVGKSLTIVTHTTDVDRIVASLHTLGEVTGCRSWKP